MHRFRHVLVLALVGAACVESVSPSADPLAGTYVAASGDSAVPVAEALTTALAARHPGMNWTVKDAGSAAALALLAKETADAAFVTRELTDTERQGTSLASLGYVAQVIAVHASNPIVGLTGEQVRGIFTGTIRDWGAVGGPAGPITVYIRTAESSTREALDPLLLGPGQSYTSAAVVAANATEMVNALVARPTGIGMVSVAHLLKGTAAKALAVDGIAPSAANTASASYPYRRPVYLAHRTLGSRPGALALRQFLRTPEGLQVLDRFF